MTDLESVPSPSVERRLRRAFAPMPPDPDAAVWADIVSRSMPDPRPDRGPGPVPDPAPARGRFDRRLPFAIAVGAALLVVVAGLAAIIGAADLARPGDLATEPATTGSVAVLPTGPSWWWHLAAIALTGLAVVTVHRRVTSRLLTAGLLILATAVFGAIAVVTIHVRLGAELAATAPAFDGFEIVAVDREWLPEWDVGRLVRIEYRPDGSVTIPDRSDGLAVGRNSIGRERFMLDDPGLDGLVHNGFARSGFSTMGGGPSTLVEPARPCWSRDRSDSFGVEFWCLAADNPTRLVVDATVLDTDGLILAWLLLIGLGLPGAVLAAIGLGRVRDGTQRPAPPR